MEEFVNSQPTLGDSVLTIGLSSLDFLEKTLEPAEGGRVTANPEELNALQRTNFTPTLTVPDVLQDGSEWRDTWKIHHISLLRPPPIDRWASKNEGTHRYLRQLRQLPRR